MLGELGWYRELLVDFPDGKHVRFEITRKQTGTHIPQVREPAPWTALGYQKCPCCPLPGEQGRCPAALSLQLTLDRLRHHASTEVVQATAIDDGGRSQTVTAPLQRIGAVLVQLSVFAGECPVGRRLKPHLSGLSPFLELNEFIPQVLNRLVADGSDVAQLVKPLHEVFIYLLKRLAGDEKWHEDAIPNSVVSADALAQVLSFRARRLNNGLAGRLGWTEPKKPAPGFLRRLLGRWKAS